MFGRATIKLGIGPHSSTSCCFSGKGLSTVLPQRLVTLPLRAQSVDPVNEV